MAGKGNVQLQKWKFGETQSPKDQNRRRQNDCWVSQHYYNTQKSIL